MVSFVVLRLSILASNRLIRGTGFFCANANNFVSAGFRVSLSVNRFCNLLNLLSSITLADEYESASILPLMQLIFTATIGGSFPLDDTWNANSELLELGVSVSFSVCLAFE